MENGECVPWEDEALVEDFRLLLFQPDIPVHLSKCISKLACSFRSLSVSHMFGGQCIRSRKAIRLSLFKQFNLAQTVHKFLHLDCLCDLLIELEVLRVEHINCLLHVIEFVYRV